MSTITLLNPLVRAARAARRAVRIQFDRMQDMRTPFGRLVIDTLARLLHVKRVPHWDGAEKERRHDAVLSAFEKAAEAMPDPVAA